MVIELLISSLLLLGETPSVNNNQFSNNNLFEIEEMRSECSKTFKTERGSFLTFFYSQEDINDSINNRNQSSSSNIVQDKYVIVGESGYQTGSTLIVGESPLVGGTYIYETIVNIDLSYMPDLSIYDIENVGFLYYKQNGNLDSINCSLITNKTFSEIEGTTTYLSTFQDSAASANYGFFTGFDFNITDATINALDNSIGNLTLALEGNESLKTVSLYSSSSTRKPICYVEYYSRYGTAHPYTYLADGDMNCHGYVRYLQFINPNSTLPFNHENCNTGSQMLLSLSSGLGNTAINYQVLTNAAFNIISYYFGDNHLRVISSYNAHINDNERRLAFRVSIDNDNHFSGNFHFICQCNDGSWACKKGNYSTYHFTGTNPDLDTNTIWYDTYINSPTLYLAYIEDSFPNGGIYEDINS